MSTITKPTYDRPTRTWRAIVPETGEVLAHSDRALVEMLYLEAIAPSVAAQVRTIGQHQPRLADRARRAGLIVAAQGVQPGRGRQRIRLPFHLTEWTGEEVARVRGSGYKEDWTGAVVGRDWYSVTETADGALECTCVDFADGSAPEIATGAGQARCCKHVLAVFIAEA